MSRCIRYICCATLCVVWLLYPSPLLAEEISDRLEIHFRPDISAIEPDFSDNAQSLATLTTLLDKISSDSTLYITRVMIDGGTSPDGDLRLNEKLSAARANSLYRFVMDGYSLPDSLVELRNNGIAWDRLRTMVADSDTPYRDEVVDIIDNVEVETWRRVNASDLFPTLVDSRNKRLMDLKYGSPYRYMMEHIFPALRRSSIVTVYFRAEIAPVAEPEEIVVAPVIEAKVEPEPEELAPEPKPYKPLNVALKTNLLYDLMLTPNIEVEIPIKNRFSIDGEWIFPWWTTKDNGNALQMLSGQVEGRYWFGDRESRPQLTGWYAGLYVGGGLYDLQWKDNGYQGEFFLAAGFGGGYAHTINRSGNLRMEYALGLGYLQTNYRYYNGKEDNQFLVWQHDGTYSWFGPTRARVSLVWYFDLKRGGVR